MRMYDVLIARERFCEEERRKKKCEPYEEIIRRLKKQEKERTTLEQSPTDRKS